MGQKMSIAGRKELIRVTYQRYQKAQPAEKRVILDEFIAGTGYHRKYAIEVLLHPPRLKPRPLKRKRKAYYSLITKQTLISLWKTANCICTKRLIPFLPELIVVLEKHGELVLEAVVKEQLLKMSPATADRLLAPERRKLETKGKCTTKPGTLLRRQIPVRTFAEWDEKVPGFTEVDLVAHCENYSGGEYLHSLVLTDVHTGWCEYTALLNKGQICACEGIERLRQRIPFRLLGLDSDNGSEFINYHLFEYCKNQKLTLTRCRPYKKNDQCHVEQKNWSIIRRTVGYDRYEGTKACESLEALYRVLRLYQNFYQPCMKLLSKERRSTSRGERTVKHYDIARTPYQRVLECESVPKEAKERLKRQYEQSNPKALLAEVRRLQRGLWNHAVIRGTDQRQEQAG